MDIYKTIFNCHQGDAPYDEYVLNIYYTSNDGTYPHIKASKITRPSDKVLVADGVYPSPRYIYPGTTRDPFTYIYQRHLGRANYLFCDYHVEFLKWGDPLSWATSADLNRNWRH